MIQRPQTGKEGQRPVVVIAPEDVQALVDVPPVADIGAGRSGQPFAGAQDSPLLPQETALPGRHIFQQGFHRCRGRFLPHPQHGQGRRAKNERVRLEMPGEGGRGKGGKQYLVSLALKGQGNRRCDMPSTIGWPFRCGSAGSCPRCSPFFSGSLPSLFQEHGDMLTGKNSKLWQQSVPFRLVIDKAVTPCRRCFRVAQRARCLPVACDQP